MRHAFLILLLALSACATTAPTGFRDPASLMTSTTRFDAGRVSGRWQVRAVFAAPGALLHPKQVELHQGPSGQIELITIDGTPVGVTATAPGRLTASDGRDFWVVWVDADYRTLAIGTPDGSFGWILDRAALGGADRIKAARDILDWVGYDLAALQEVT